MNGRISRYEILRRDDGVPTPDGRTDAFVACPCCAGPLEAGAACAQCGYPSNSAAWVDYEGCC